MIIADGIRAAASRTPDKIAIIESGRRLSFRALVERIDRVSNLAYAGLGLRHGDLAAVLLPNRLEYMEILCGLSSAGVSVATIGPAVPVLPRNTMGKVLRRALRDILKNPSL